MAKLLSVWPLFMWTRVHWGLFQQTESSIYNLQVLMIIAAHRQNFKYLYFYSFNFSSFIMFVGVLFFDSQIYFAKYIISVCNTFKSPSQVFAPDSISLVIRASYSRATCQLGLATVDKLELREHTSYTFLRWRARAIKSVIDTPGIRPVRIASKCFKEPYMQRQLH